MFANAYAILDDLKLPHPPVVGVNELASLSPDSWVYLRGAKDLPLLNLRTRAAYAFTHIDALRRMERDGTLYTIEISPESLLGGATFIKGSLYTYTEICAGHVSGLLESGYCCARAFKPNDASSAAVLFQRQTDMVVNSDGERERRVVGASYRPQIISAVSQSTRSLAASTGPLLLEWLYSKMGTIIFVDAKPFDMDVHYEKIFDTVSDNAPTTLIDTIPSSEKEIWHPKPEDTPRYKEKIPDNYIIYAEHEALLSHFFTNTRNYHRRIFYRPIDINDKMLIEI